MGYYTHYKLSIKLPGWATVYEAPKGESAEDILLGDTPWGTEQLLPIYRELLKMDSPVLGEEPRTWYDHQDDMRTISRKFPEILFTLNGEGEEQGDIWKAWFLGGRMQYEEATFQIGEFNPEKLDTPREEDD